jgi:hypothetical protein
LHAIHPTPTIICVVYEKMRVVCEKQRPKTDSASKQMGGRDGLFSGLAKEA